MTGASARGAPQQGGQDWPRVERLDAARMIAAIRERAGVRLRIAGPCPGGQVGASYVTWPDGHQSVLTWRPGTTPERFRDEQLTVLGALRAAGYPAPAAELVVPAGDGAAAIAVVWELLPGQPVRELTAGLLGQALRLIELHAGRLAGHREVPPFRLYLSGDGPGFCLHGPLRDGTARARRLHRWITEVAARHPSDILDGDDAVHGDFQAANFLSDGAGLRVVDWDGACRGDRRLDLVTLRFGMHGLPADPAAVRQADDLLDAIPARTLEPLWAHLSLRMADWSIRHFSPADTEHWLDLAETRIS